MIKRLIFGVLIVLALYAIFHHSDPAGVFGPAVEAPAASAPDTFAGQDCTGDCSGHDAGYRWAEEKGISDEDDCDAAGDHSNSPSFAEGCKAFANGDAPSEDDEDKDKDDQSKVLAAGREATA